MILDLSDPDVVRFMSFVDILPNGCWYWTGARSQGQAEEMTDAVVATLQGEPVKKVTTIQGSEVYWIDGDVDARSAFGNDFIVQRGYFVPVTE